MVIEMKTQKEIEARLEALEQSSKLMPNPMPNELIVAIRTLRWVLNKGGVE